MAWLLYRSHDFGQVTLPYYSQFPPEVLGGLKESLHPGEMKTHVHTKTYAVIFTAALLITDKKWK